MTPVTVPAGGEPVAAGNAVINLHVHLPPNFSAFASPEQAVALAAAQGVRVLGTSNYYDYAVYAPFSAAAVKAGVFPVFGLEVISWLESAAAKGEKINDPGNPGKFYLCGKGLAAFANPDASSSAILGRVRDGDSKRMDAMCAALAACFAQAAIPVKLSGAEIRAAVAKKCGVAPETVFLQERHVAQAFQEAFFAAVPEPARTAKLTALAGAECAKADAGAVQNAIRSHLMKAGKPAYVAENFIPFADAKRMVLGMGGIPCYPILIDGAAPVCGFEATPAPATLVANLATLGLHAAEFIPNRNAPETLLAYAKALRAAGVVVTAGTEHNTPDLIPVPPVCVKGVAIPAEAEALFREGAMVAIAHQWLVANGKPGYVAADGTVPGDREARIREFAALGAAVLVKFQEENG